MTLEIVQDGFIDVLDIINRSPVANVFGASQKLANCILSSQSTWAGVVDGEVACVWGVISPSLLSDQAYLWLLTTDLVDEHKFLLVRHAQIIVEDLLKEYRTIVGHVHAERPRSIKWLKMLGAKFGDPDGLCIPFRIERWIQ